MPREDSRVLMKKLRRQLVWSRGLAFFDRRLCSWVSRREPPSIAMKKSIHRFSAAEDDTHGRPLLSQTSGNGRGPLFLALDDPTKGRRMRSISDADVSELDSLMRSARHCFLANCSCFFNARQVFHSCAMARRPPQRSVVP